VLKVANLVSKPISTNRLPKDRRGLSIALRILALSPAVLAALMYVLTPTYFRPMLDNFVGLVLLGILVSTICVGYGLVEAGIWLFRKGRVVLGVLVLVGYSITWFVAMWIVLLGPAALILMKPRS
jgi:hypothetical protein